MQRDSRSRTLSPISLCGPPPSAAGCTEFIRRNHLSRERARGVHSRGFESKPNPPFYSFRSFGSVCPLLLTRLLNETFKLAPLLSSPRAEAAKLDARPTTSCSNINLDPLLDSPLSLGLLPSTPSPRWPWWPQNNGRFSTVSSRL